MQQPSHFRCQQAPYWELPVRPWLTDLLVPGFYLESKLTASYPFRILFCFWESESLWALAMNNSPSTESSKERIPPLPWRPILLFQHTPTPPTYPGCGAIGLWCWGLNVPQSPCHAIASLSVNLAIRHMPGPHPPANKYIPALLCGGLHKKCLP